MPTAEDRIKELKVEVFDIINQQEIFNGRIQQLQEIKQKKLQELNEIYQQLQKESKKEE